MIQLALFTESDGAPAPAHSKIGASSMYRWQACPGSVRLCETIPNEESPYAKEGTHAHKLASDILERKPVLVEDAATLSAVMVYVDYVRETSAGNLLLVEHRFDLSRLHNGMFETADAVVYLRETKHLIVADLKFGRGVLVEPEENVQLMYYALGAYLYVLSMGFQVLTVETVVVQPRYDHEKGPVRGWTFDSFRLLDFLADLIDAAKRTEDPNAPLIGGKHCRFCSAKKICPSYSPMPPRQKRLEATEVFQPVHVT